jgi:hypothetical protein
MTTDNVVGEGWFRLLTARQRPSTAVILWKAGVKSVTVTHGDQ